MSTRPDIDAAHALIDAMAPALDLAIALDDRESVARHLARVLAVAALFMDFDLPDDIEIAPVFRP